METKETNSGWDLYKEVIDDRVTDLPVGTVVRTKVDVERYIEIQRKLYGADANKRVNYKPPGLTTPILGTSNVQVYNPIVG